jgi:hypothetical protein
VKTTGFETKAITDRERVNKGIAYDIFIAA